MATNGGDVKFTLSGDSTKLNKSLRDASKNLGKMHKAGKGASNSLSKELKTAAKGAAIGVAAVGGALLMASKAAFALAAGSSAYLDEMVHGAALAGLTTKEFTTMGFAIEAAGGKASQLTPAMATLTDGMAQARDGTKAYEEAFGALGVEVTKADGSLRDSGDVFGEVTEALSEMESQTEKSAAAQAIFGKRNASVALALGEANDVTAEFSAIVDTMITPENLAQSAAFDESMARLQLNAKSAMVQIGSKLTPVITDMMDAASRAAPWIIGIFKKAVPFIENFVNGARFAGAAIADMATVAIATGKVIGAALLVPFKFVLEQVNKIRVLMGQDPFELEFLQKSDLKGNILALGDAIGDLGIMGGNTGDVLRAGWYGAGQGLAAAGEETETLTRKMNKLTAAVEEAVGAADEFNPDDFNLGGFVSDGGFNPDDFSFMTPEEVAEMNKEIADNERDAFEQRLGYAGDFVNASGDLAVGLSARLGASAEEQAMASYLVSQTTALAEIGINTVVAASKAAAQTGVLAPISLPAIYALGAVQAAAVLATPAPKFHSGGMAPDERLITAQTGEAVLSRSGVAAAGGASGVNNLNRGGGGGAIVVVNQYRHRVFDSFIMDNLRRTGSPLAAAIGATGNKAGILR
jgi:hypothetical protein